VVPSCSIKGQTGVDVLAVADRDVIMVGDLDTGALIIADAALPPE
jgi:hypothetical protein